MKIIFICGSLEPGKDGVGDYTRRFCAQLIKQGIKVGVLALNDKFIDSVFEESQNIDGEDICCYRLPSLLKLKVRGTLAQAWVEKHNPEWLSLQFVSYAYQSRGLPFGLANQLKKISSNRKWHIMFHEIWVGISKGSPKKEVFVGKIQRNIIKKLVFKLSPKIITTQTQLYKFYIKKLGFNVSILPLFSNIPVSSLCNKNKKELKIGLLKERLELILFGSIHPNTPIEKFVSDINSFCKTQECKNNIITFIGRTGIEKTRWKNIFKENNFHVNDLGEESSEQISLALTKANIGISTTPLYLIEKSGTAIAMRMHKLPIVSVAKKWRPSVKTTVNHPLDVLEFNGDNFENIFELKLNNYDSNATKNVTGKFLNEIKRL